MAAYELAIFDFDGTLADTMRWFLDLSDRMAERFDFRPFDRDELPRLRRMSARELLAHQRIAAWKVPLIAAQARKEMAAHLDEIRLFEGTSEMLHALAERGVTLAIVSSNAEASVRAVLGPENERLITAFDCGASLFGKTAKFRALLDRFGLPPSAAIAVADETRDLEAARGARIAFGAVMWGYSDPEALRAHGPDAVYATMREIVEHVG